MILKSYLVSFRRNVYTQYPNDHTASFLEPICRNLKTKHQVVVYRDGGLMYYCYYYQSSEAEIIGISIASGELCAKIRPLYDRFVSCFVSFAKRGVLFHFDNSGEICYTNGIAKSIGEVEELFRWLREHVGSGKPDWTSIPPQDHSIAKGTSVLYNFTEDDHRDILEATKHYTCVFITMHNPTPTSYSETVKRMALENQTLVAEKEKLADQITKINKQKEHYKLVIGLAVVMFVGAVVAVAIVSDKNAKIKSQLATILDNEKTIVSQGNTISFQNNAINEQSQCISRLESRIANLESANEDLQYKNSTLNSERTSILNHKPFTVTHTSFSFERGTLTVYYYAPSGGTKDIRCKVIRESDSAEVFNLFYTLSSSTSSGNNSFSLSGLAGLSSSTWYRFEIYAHGNFCGGGRH